MAHKLKKFSEGYLTITKNDNFYRRLFQKEKIDALKEVLNENSKSLRKLQKHKHNLNSRKPISRRELNELYPMVCEEVNEFLECGAVKKPLLLYGVPLSRKDFSYERLFKTIKAKKECREKILPIIAHEYGHHIGHLKGFRKSIHALFQEGFCRGIERHVANELYKETDDESYIYHTLDLHVGELKSAYIWASSIIRKRTNQSLLKIDSSQDNVEEFHRAKLGEASPHATGNSLFSIYELQEGRRIYKDVLTERFKPY